MYGRVEDTDTSTLSHKTVRIMKEMKRKRVEQKERRSPNPYDTLSDRGEGER